MRWYGPKDGVQLEDILQAGCTGVVHALHHIPVGEVWPLDEIQSRVHHINKAGLDWKVVESLPVSEQIKTRSGNFQDHIENYKLSLQNLAECGIEVITYNFMPVLDWTRTNVDYILKNGNSALLFDKIDLGVFDIFLLERTNARESFSADEIEKIEQRFHQMTNEEKNSLQKNILLGLPGSDDALEAKEVLKAVQTYDKIDREQLKQHLRLFLQEVAPVAEGAGIKLAIHPDDPPISVLGLPRIVSTEEDLEFIVNSHPSKGNGLCLCTGSLGANPDIDLPKVIRRFQDNIHFFHLRNIRRENQFVFYESDHLAGENDMKEVMKAVLAVTKHQQTNIPMRPDHGHQFSMDRERNYYPGYSFNGRLRGLAELSGLEMGLINL